MAGLSRLARKMKISEDEAAARIQAKLDDPDTLAAMGDVFQIDMEDEAEVALFRELLAVKLTGDDDAFREKAIELDLIGRMQKLGLLPG
jgi:hypothetical protein